MEKKGILGPTSGRRPGDVTIPIWKNGKGLAIDVADQLPESTNSSGHSALRGVRRVTEAQEI